MAISFLFLQGDRDMVESNPYISVIIPNYNYEKYIEQTVSSVIAQTYKNFQLIIIDDGSNDNSLNVIYNLANKDSRIKVLQHEDKKNHGLSATLQLGINAADGEYIAILEADDLWTKNCLELRVETIIKGNSGVVFNNINPLIMDGANAEWFYAYVPRIMEEHNKRITGDNNYIEFEMREEFLIENKIPTFSCSMIKKIYLKKCCFNTPIQQWLDRWLWCQLAQMTTFMFIPNKLTNWRLHNDSYNNNSQSNSNSSLQVLVSYIKNNLKFYSELRQCLKNKNFTQNTNLKYKFLLYTPVMLVMLLRFLLCMRYKGFYKTILLILKKISPINLHKG